MIPYPVLNILKKTSGLYLSKYECTKEYFLQRLLFEVQKRNASAIVGFTTING